MNVDDSEYSQNLPLNSPNKSIMIAYMLWLVSGLFGGHRIYARCYKSGISMLALTVFSLPSMPGPPGNLMLLLVMFWAVADLAFIPSMIRSCNAMSDSDELSLQQNVQTSIDGRRPHNLLHSSTFLDASAQASGYRIEYADADGVITDREINVISITATGYAIYIRAYCRSRQAERTFRADRILSAIELSGKLPIVDIENHFYKLISDEQRPDPDHESVMSRVSASLSVLVWIAMADRDISSDEEEILLSFITERNGLAGSKFASISWSATKAVAWIEAARPTFATAISTLAKMSRTGREYALVKRYSEIVADAGGHASENRRRQLFN